MRDNGRLVVLVLVVLVAILAVWMFQRARSPEMTSEASPIEANSAHAQQESEATEPPLQVGAGGEEELIDYTDLTREVVDAFVSGQTPSAYDAVYILATSEESDAWIRLVADYSEREYETWATAPRYDSVRSSIRATAAEMLEDIDPQDTVKILELADAESQRFWDKGGLISAEAYDDGYLARAILEIAVENDSEDFALLMRLAQATADMTPSIRYREWDDIMPLLGRVKDGVMSGKVPVCEDAMRAMYSWTLVNCTSGNDPVDAVPVFQWLVDNAEEGGWPETREFFAEGLESGKNSQPFAINLYTPTGPYKKTASGPFDEEKAAAEALGVRRLPLCNLPPKYERYLKPAWKDVVEEP